MRASAPGYSGSDQSREGELEDEPEDPDHQQDVGEVRIDQDPQEPIDDGHGRSVHLDPRGMQRDLTVRGGHDAAFQGAEEIRETGRLQVRHVLRHGLVRGDGLALPHRLVRPGGIPAPQLSNVAPSRLEEPAAQSPDCCEPEGHSQLCK